MLQHLDIETIWNTTTDREGRKLVNELVDAVVIHADRLEVRLHETPAITVLFSEVGLRAGSGTGPVLSEERHEPYSQQGRRATADHALPIGAISASSYVSDRCSVGQVVIEEVTVHRTDRRFRERYARAL